MIPPLKRIRMAALVLVTIVLTAWISTGESDESIDTSRSIDGGAVIAIRPLTLNEGADTEGFEAFAAESYAPAFEKHVPGVRSFILKGDRGENKGKYLHVYVFDSEETRNYYFPREDEGVSEAAAALWGQLPELDWSSFIDTTVAAPYTDYIVIE